ncbi:hypothetical protein CBS147317_2336 [Penicillium roqueforti]|nr:hypothetical protein LCP963914a_525 [Penicillium roqueforti]KAI2705384.1 hypothetical protein CBS147372_1687 [Penicillium roqueforti]KAI2731615.1 hypothetical protein CBS147354_724 [Penicillium roqueforti]KAI3166393.1 hypothetical protein CBS147317_2336 [Penicillium roqueforti]KAI3278088.1 hypothetical protein CBS147309_2287 [Penicillium roqueforti]
MFGPITAVDERASAGNQSPNCIDLIFGLCYIRLGLVRGIFDAKKRLFVQEPSPPRRDKSFREFGKCSSSFRSASWSPHFRAESKSIKTACESRIRKLNWSRGPACLASLMRSIKNPKHAAIFRQMAKESWADIIALNSLPQPRRTNCI